MGRHLWRSCGGDGVPVSADGKRHYLLTLEGATWNGRGTGALSMDHPMDRDAVLDFLKNINEESGKTLVVTGATLLCAPGIPMTPGEASR